MLSLRKKSSRRKSRTAEKHLSIKDPESLDSCIQGVLSPLYPPFNCTAPTLLWQLYSVVERQYHGDGLRCVLDYLLPAKSILQGLQQSSRERYASARLYHTGWPLCLQEKVLVHLGPLHKVRLRPGDFYLQVAPRGGGQVRLLLKCLAPGGHALAELPVPEGMITRVFTPMFPDELLTHTRLSPPLPPLHSCLLAAGPTAVFRTPWANVATPLLLADTQSSPSNTSLSPSSPGNKGSGSGGARLWAFRKQLRPCSTSGSTGTLDSLRSSRDSLQSAADSTASEPVLRRYRDVSCGSVGGGSSYGVTLDNHSTDTHWKSTSSLSHTHSQPHTNLTPQTHCHPHTHQCTNSHTHPHSHSHQHTHPNSQPRSQHTHPNSHPHSHLSQHKHAQLVCATAPISTEMERSVCFRADVADPSMSSPARRRSTRDSSAFETRRLFRKSYMEALQNPMSLGSSTESVALEDGHHDEQRSSTPPNPATISPTPHHRQLLPRKLCGRGWLGGMGDEEGRAVSPLLLLRGIRTPEPAWLERDQDRDPERNRNDPQDLDSLEPRPRSKSLERMGRGIPLRGHRTRSSSGGASSFLPRKLVNGHTPHAHHPLHTPHTQHSLHTPHTTHTLRPGTPTTPSSDGGNSLRDEMGTNESPSHSGYHRSSQSIDECQPDPLTPPPKLSDLNRDLLTSGAVTLPGCRDRSGRLVLKVCARSAIWTNGGPSTKDLACILSYLSFTLRKERRDQGLTVLLDGRRLQTVSLQVSTLLTALHHTQASLSCLLLLLDREGVFRPDRELSVPCEVLTSLRALHKLIDPSQLNRELEGTFHYDHHHYITFREKIEPFAHSCSQAVASLQESISSLHNTTLNSNLDSTQEVTEVIADRQHLMKCVLDDSRLNHLRLEGGTFLARIRKEEPCDNDMYRDAVDMVSALYNSLDEEVHRLVIQSNRCLQHLEELLQLRRFEEATAQIKHWFVEEGERHLAPLDSLILSSASIVQLRRNLDDFMDQSEVKQKQAFLLLQSFEGCQSPALQEFKRFLGAMATRREQRKEDLDTLQNLYEIHDSGESWLARSEECLQRVREEPEEHVGPHGVMQEVQELCEEAQRFSPKELRNICEKAEALGVGREQERFGTLWRRCQVMRSQLEDALTCTTTAEIPSGDEQDNALITSQRITVTPCGEGRDSGLAESSEGRCSPEPSPLGVSPDRTPSFLFDEGRDFSKSYLIPTPTDSASSSPSQSHSPLPSRAELGTDSNGNSIINGGGVSPLVGLYDDTDSDCTVDSCMSSRSEPVRSTISLSPTPSRLRKPPLRKMMKTSMSFDPNAKPRDGSGSGVSGGSSAGGVRGYTGVQIRGLEVANNVCVENTLQRPEVKSPLLIRSQSLSVPPRTHPHVLAHSLSHSPTRLDNDIKTHSSNKIQHIMDEMIRTEREYVRSLGYVLHHYFPELERFDVPQDLRGKRSVLFGNLEKLWDFHTHHFLQELEQCVQTPLAVSQCFLTHEDQFGMYALYSKNKPRSDALLASHGNSFFKNKQLELGDRMDVASYLLKPIQRMSKYALLLKDLIKQCSPAQEAELRDLCSAHEMVTFQLRHGNDLLAMDAIRGCDVNLKEQGELRCQDEFMVWCGRRKYLRHVFLFEDLILFSKTKKIEGGYDIYIYKQSYKTAEIGMTENVGESGLRFEIWFRRRKSQDTFILQAGSPEVKATWTSIIGKILWRQALRNRELRMQEMVSMGIGNKPFMDIKPSDAAISDRAIDFIMKGSESRTRASIAVSSFEHSAPYKRPHSTISNSSTSSSSSQSSSSLLGPLNLHLYPHTHSHTHAHTHHPGHSAFAWPYDCIEEDELEQDSASQPSVKTSSSSQCASSDSISGHSSVTLSAHSAVAMETSSEDPPSFITSALHISDSVQSESEAPAPPSPLFTKEVDFQETNSTFITAL